MLRCCITSLTFAVLTFAAQAQDSLVVQTDLIFSSPFEKESFGNYASGKAPDFFNLLMSNGSLLTDDQIAVARARFYSHLKNLDTDKMRAKKPDKMVKAIVTSIESNYLKKYVANSRFEEIFYNGNFSEISGTALYCLAFEYFGVPYQIKEEAANVYVIAYPQSEKIQVESTVSALVFITFDDAFQKQFIELLRNQKVISEQEFARNSIKSLFETYYFDTKSNLTISGLTSLHYLNDGNKMLETESYEMAFQQFEKAYYLHPSPKAAYMLMQTGSTTFLRHTQQDLKQADLLAKISRHSAAGITPEMIVGEFAKVIQSLLFDKQDKELLHDYYGRLRSKITNLKIQREIVFAYNYENGRYFYNQARYKDALPFFEETLVQKPANQDAATMMVSTLSQLGVNQAQSPDYSKMLVTYEGRFPSLSENNLFNALLASSLLVQQAIQYESGKAADGESFRAKFENLYSQHSDITLNTFLLGKAYSAAAVYYFKKGQTKKAKELIDFGLKLSPENYELRTRKQMIR